MRVNIDIDFDGEIDQDQLNEKVAQALFEHAEELQFDHAQRNTRGRGYSLRWATERE